MGPRFAVLCLVNVRKESSLGVTSSQTGDGWWTGRHALHPCSLFPREFRGWPWDPLSYLILLQGIHYRPSCTKGRDFVSTVVSQSLRTTSFTSSFPPVLHLKPKSNLYSLCVCPMLAPPPGYLSVLWLFFCSPNYRSPGPL